MLFRKFIVTQEYCSVKDIQLCTYVNEKIERKPEGSAAVRRRVRDEEGDWNLIVDGMQ